MPDTTHIKGLSEMERFMEQLAPKIAANIARGGLRAGMNVVKPIAQSNIHSVSGELAKGLKVGTRSKGLTVTATLRATGPHGFIAKFLEFGTAAHNIAAKFGGWLSFANIFRKEIHHPGARPKPFMRPALDSESSRAVVAVGEYIKTRLTKEGLDVAHVQVEGDE